MKVGNRVKINTAPPRLTQFVGLFGYLKINDETKPTCTVIVTKDGQRLSIELPRSGLAVAPS